MSEILLAIPPSPYMTSDRAFPPLGILYVASYLKKKGKDISICDLTGEKRWIEKFKRILRKESPLYVGITATTSDMPIAIKLLKIAKKCNSYITVAIGGPHATILPESCKIFDKVVIGDGWNGSLKAFSAFKSKFIEEAIIENLDDMPFPARELIDLSKYIYLINSLPATNIMTHLGCPFKCVFCVGRNKKFYTKVRFRSPENVIEEMDLLNRNYGFKAFVFYDDEFNLKKDYVIKLCNLLAKRKYIWRAPIRTDLFDDEIASYMKKAGCVEVTAGVESGSDKVLEIIGKRTSSYINSKARRICLKNGIRFKAFVMVGLPGASEEDEKLTEKWIIENKPDSVDININLPYPSTPQYDNFRKYNLNFNYNFRKVPVSYKFHSTKYKSFCSNTFMSRLKILKIRNAMAKKFMKQ